MGFEEFIVVVDVRYLVIAELDWEMKEKKVRGGEEVKGNKVGAKAGRRKQTGNNAPVKKLLGKERDNYTYTDFYSLIRSTVVPISFLQLSGYKQVADR